GLIDNTKPILSFLPIFLIGVVFGLAMDYQVFLRQAVNRQPRRRPASNRRVRGQGQPVPDGAMSPRHCAR
ncbi:hypothetical protein, partial [Gordonia aichiensis]